MLNALIFLITLHTAHAAPASGGEAKVDHHRSCALGLLGKEAAHPLLLATAVLFRDQQNQVHFAYGSYFFSQHSSLLYQAANQIDIKDVLWMGEVRYEFMNGKPMIHEANETSGYFWDNKLSGWRFGNGAVVPLVNDYRNLPAELLAEKFDGTHYDDRRKHLAAELNISNKNLRHTIGESLNAIFRIFALAKYGISQDPEKDLRDNIASAKDDIELAEQVLSYSLLKKMISHEDVDVILRAIAMLKDPQLTHEEALKMDPDLIQWQAHGLTDFDAPFFLAGRSAVPIRS